MQELPESLTLRWRSST